MVDVVFETDLPPVYTVLHTGKNKEVSIEVLAQLDAQTVRGIALNPTQGLARGMVVKTDGEELTVPIGNHILGRMFDVFGNTIDHLKPLSKGERRNVHQQPPKLSKRAVKSEIYATGIKAIDVLIPLERGGKAGLFGGAGVGKTVLLMEIIHNMVGHDNDVSMFCGIWELCREGNELYNTMKDAGLLKDMVMLFGQMNEPPGARFRVGHAALTMAEYYKTISETIKVFDEVLLLGPTNAKVELLNILQSDQSFSKVKMETRTTDKMTENQEHAYVREYFSKGGSTV